MLITLTIIGVIAALTIPNLLQKYTEQTTVKKVQKFYSNLSNAYNLAEKENGTIPDWKLPGYDQGGAERIYELLFKPYFKIAKNCGVTNTGTCIRPGNYKTINNETFNGGGYVSSAYYKFNLDDSSTVIFYQWNEIILVVYDVDGGTHGPNQYGKDTFGFYVSSSTNRVAPYGLQNGIYSFMPFSNECKINSAGNNNAGSGCAAWVIYKGNMDYLHCTGLKWTSRSCKEK